MAQHTEAATSPCNIDTMSKLVIQPISCEWSSCTATINSWHTLQKHYQLHYQKTIRPTSKENVMICEIEECLNYKHRTPAKLEEHINKSHLDLIQVPCPALGCLYTAAASQSCLSHFLEKHTKLIKANPKDPLFKPQISPLLCQLSPPPPLPIDPTFPSYKLMSYMSASRPHGKPACKGLDSITNSISSLRVSYNPDEPDKSKQHGVKKFMALSTPRCHVLEPDDDIPRHSFTDLSYNSPKSLLDTLEAQPRAQLTPIPSDPQADSMLSAPPPWKLQADRPVGMPLTVGYSTFVALCLP